MIVYGAVYWWVHQQREAINEKFAELSVQTGVTLKPKKIILERWKQAAAGLAALGPIIAAGPVSWLLETIGIIAD